MPNFQDVHTQGDGLFILKDKVLKWIQFSSTFDFEDKILHHSFCMLDCSVLWLMLFSLYFQLNKPLPPDKPI